MNRSLALRSRNHPAYWAFIVHRVSGIALAAFLPVHFWALAQALRGEAALDAFLRLADAPLAKFAEWGLVIEFLPWSGLRKDWIAATVGISIASGLAFALALL